MQLRRVLCQTPIAHSRSLYLLSSDHTSRTAAKDRTRGFHQGMRHASTTAHLEPMFCKARIRWKTTQIQQLNRPLSVLH
jgi:hypothetical protein